MKRTALLLAFVLLSLAVLMVGACKKEQEKAVVVIGLQGPITGAWAYEGQMAKQSVETAAKLINQAGGILDGRQIQIEVVDDAGEPKTGAMAATKITGMEKVVASISTYGSSICEPAAAIYEKFEMVNVGYGVTAVTLTEKGRKYFFRTCGRDDSQGIYFAEYVPQKFAARRIAGLGSCRRAAG